MDLKNKEKFQALDLQMKEKVLHCCMSLRQIAPLTAGERYCHV